MLSSRQGFISYGLKPKIILMEKAWFLLLLFGAVGFGSAFPGQETILGYGIDVPPGIPKKDIANYWTSNSLIRSLVIPEYVKNFLDIPIDQFQTQYFNGVENEECIAHVKELYWRLRRLNESEAWVFQMVDSWGKPPEGILSGHVNALGDYDECVGIRVRDLEFKASNETQNFSNSFVGRYFLTYLMPYTSTFAYYFDRLNRTGANGTDFDISPMRAVSPDELLRLMNQTYGALIAPTFGLCFPNSCQISDVQQMTLNAADRLYGRPQNYTQYLWPGVGFTYVADKPPLDAADISVICLLGVIAAICLSATIVDLYLNYDSDKPAKGGLPYQCLMCFSLYTNVPKLLSTRPTPDDLGCLHGIRFLSMAWIVLAHTWFVILYMPYWNMVDVKLIQDDWTILTVLNASYSVDTFFVLSGLLVSYNVLKMLQKTKGKLNIPMFYLHRYLRLTPVYAITIGIMATLVPYAASGPYWFIMDRWGEICVNNWWSNMLYINNFYNTSWLCQGEAWYLADDMQFYIVSPIFLLPLYHWETIGVILLSIATLLSCLCPALMVHLMDTSPTTIPSKVGHPDVTKWFTNIYIKPYSRIQTYFVGVWLGYLLYKTKGRKVHIPRYLVLLGWAISTATCLSAMYGVADWYDPDFEIPDVSRFIYAGFSRFGWGVSLSWIIFACVKGYGWLVNDFLSWKFFMPLGRLGYCIFLVSLHLQMILHISFKQPIGYSNYSMTNFFLAHMIMSVMVAFIFTISMETPFMQLEKILLGGGGKKKPPGPAQKVSGLPVPPSKEGTMNGESPPPDSKQE